MPEPARAVPPGRCAICDAPGVKWVDLSGKDAPLTVALYECGAVVLYGAMHTLDNHPRPCPKAIAPGRAPLWHLPPTGGRPNRWPQEAVKPGPPKGSIIPVPSDNREPG